MNVENGGSPFFERASFFLLRSVSETLKIAKNVMIVFEFVCNKIVLFQLCFMHRKWLKDIPFFVKI